MSNKITFGGDSDSALTCLCSVTPNTGGFGTLPGGGGGPPLLLGVLPWIGGGGGGPLLKFCCPDPLSSSSLLRSVKSKQYLSLTYFIKATKYLTIKYLNHRDLMAYLSSE